MHLAAKNFNPKPYSTTTTLAAKTRQKKPKLLLSGVSAAGLGCWTITHHSSARQSMDCLVWVLDRQCNERGTTHQ